MLETLIDSYVKNPGAVMFFRVLSGNELRDFFEEKWQMLRIRSSLIHKLSTFQKQ